jgi:SAM-dependent methyltransferase
MNRRHAFLRAKRLLFPGIDVATRRRMRFVRHFRAGDIRTLDVGCGNGAFSLAAHRLGNDVVGIDLNPVNIARCNEYAEFLDVDRPRCRFEVANVYDLVASGERFDQIVAFEILEHLERDAEVVAALAALLEPGGLLHVSSPYLHRTPYVGEVLSDVEDGGHMRLGYTFEQLDSMFRAAGLSPTIRGAAVGPWSRRALELVNRAEARFGLIGGVAAFGLAYPPTMIERVPREPHALILYAQAEKH